MKPELGFRVLIVEDEADVRATLAEALSNEGYEVTTAGTAEEGLNELRKERVHLVVTDYRLPDHTGAWMLQEAGEAGMLSTTKVLLITGESSPSLPEGIRVLRKPLEQNLFLRAVWDALAPARGKSEERGDVVRRGFRDWRR